MKKNKLKRNIALKLFSTSATATMLFSSLLGPISAMAESVETTTVEEQVQFDETQENQTQSEELEVPVVEEHIHNGEEENILNRADYNSITAPEVLKINLGEGTQELKNAFRNSAQVYHNGHLVGSTGCIYPSYNIAITGIYYGVAGEQTATFYASYGIPVIPIASKKIKVLIVGPSTPPPSGSGINGGSISNGLEMLEKDTLYGNLRIYLPSKPVQLTTKDTENISNVDRLLKKTVSFQVDSYPTNDYTLNLTSTNVISGKPGSYYVNYELKYKSYVRTFKMMVDVTKIDNSLEEGQKAVDDLFTDNQHTSLKAGIVQANIDAAKVIVNQVTDASKKEELLNEIQKAQDLLTSQEATEKAETIVNDLFADDDHTTLAEGVTQEVIDAAKEAVNQVTDAGKKEELTNEINKAQDALNEKIAEAERQEAASKAVDELFKDNDPTTGIIKDEVTQEAIDAAKELVASVTDPAKKEELTNEINKAQDALNEKIAEAASKAVDELFKDN
ncbi:toxin Cry1Ac domain D-VI-related protein, partial [Carnobacterium maltaromaticum]|uniref:toxin Cry1Ac domain D-VI-related protein n=1 Tax=Carnobacterium maltaromaticum TaxID=2751 RepID=UPI001F2F93A8